MMHLDGWRNISRQRGELLSPELRQRLRSRHSEAQERRLTIQARIGFAQRVKTFSGHNLSGCVPMQVPEVGLLLSFVMT